MKKYIDILILVSGIAFWVGFLVMINAHGKQQKQLDVSAHLWEEQRMVDQKQNEYMTKLKRAIEAKS